MVDHDIGDLVRLWHVFYDETGAQTAPTTVTLLMRHPTTGLSEEVTNEAAAAPDETLAEAALGVTLSGVTGLYKATFTPDAAGVWRYRWVGEGALVEEHEDWFEVPLQLVPDVVTPP